MTDVVRSSIAARDRLIFALDVPTPADARAIVKQLDGEVRFYKLGLELFVADGFFDLLTELRESGFKTFVDLKLFDVPATVGRAVTSLAERGADFVTVHGNQSIMEAAAKAKRNNLKVLAVTALTSLDRGDLDDLGFDCDVEQLVLSRARRALQAGCDGVVSSGLEVATLRREAPAELVVVTPGIRPIDNRPSDDQKRVMTPTEAIRAGADYLVIGRPIRDAADPAKAAADIQREIAAALT